MKQNYNPSIYARCITSQHESTQKKLISQHDIKILSKCKLVIIIINVILIWAN